MIFWSSAEISPEAATSYRQIRNPTEDLINVKLADVSVQNICVGWKWAFIAIIVSPKLGVEYSERVRRNQKLRVFEFRLTIDFEDFVSSSWQRQADLVFEQLHRSVDLMAKWKVSKADQEQLHEILLAVRAQLDLVGS
jgi:hypothetical protein